ncbi:MAG: glycosyltransferase [Elusimicrobiota bacterium]|jgi:glycosyltransferase involved in cell wall biosynthesis|nr:glycosyltransferase [Elusimicrobiota bacterium]
MSDNHSPVFSIIMPVYNASKHLNKALESLTGQTFADIEILCVNDGSLDNSLSVLKQWAEKDSRILVFNQENKGPGEARNKALDNASGKYILFCDADDFLEADACAECFETMENNNVDVAMFNVNCIEVDVKSHYPSNTFAPSGIFEKAGNSDNQSPFKENERKVFLNKRQFFKTALFGGIWNICYRRDLINAYFLRFSNHKYSEDTIFRLCYFMTIGRGGLKVNSEELKIKEFEFRRKPKMQSALSNLLALLRHKQLLSNLLAQPTPRSKVGNALTNNSRGASQEVKSGAVAQFLSLSKTFKTRLCNCVRPLLIREGIGGGIKTAGETGKSENEAILNKERGKTESSVEVLPIPYSQKFQPQMRRPKFLNVGGGGTPNNLSAAAKKSLKNFKNRGLKRRKLKCYLI